MSSHPLPNLTGTHSERAMQRRRLDRMHLARHHDELRHCTRHLRLLVDRLEETGTEPHARRLSAAIVEQMDALLPDVLAREARALSPGAGETDDPWARQACDQLRADHGWISANWYELRPQLGGLAQAQSWVDIDLLRDAADLFCSLLREHVRLAATVLELDARHVAVEQSLH